MNNNDTENSMVLPGYDDLEEVDEDLAFEIQRQQAIDDAIEAGDHLRDQRKDDALMDVLEDIARTHHE